MTADEPHADDARAAEPERPGGVAGGQVAGRQRLQKVLAAAGLGSRRRCEELIAAGRVTVDGTVATLGDRADAATQRIELDGVTVVVDTGLVHYLANKPAGVVSTSSDPQGRPTVVDLVPPEPRVFSVGRLDADTEGLIILTNDGELTQLLTHPSHGVVKTYLAEVEGSPGASAMHELRSGVELDDGKTAPARVTVVQRRGPTTAVEIGIHEGRKRQVRRMFEAVGHPVVRLVRTKIGSLADPRLAPGAWRPLGAREVRSLYESADRGNPPEATNAPG